LWGSDIIVKTFIIEKIPDGIIEVETLVPATINKLGSNIALVYLWIPGVRDIKTPDISLIKVLDKSKYGDGTCVYLLTMQPGARLNIIMTVGRKLSIRWSGDGFGFVN